MLVDAVLERAEAGLLPLRVNELLEAKEHVEAKQMTRMHPPLTHQMHLEGKEHLAQ